ncbi:hypothetical protein G9X64_30665 [Rhizobium sophorae]|uniref:Uncharacterized protein n=1 Tax=Rhizobium sophorae TaxID=1535242 RepID=A0A7Y3SC39_9HYPH|nr:hypothetical protein [Rhizobium sophorae]NNU40770.1 hypothetical protein [Rhizobium sophorae]
MSVPFEPVVPPPSPPPLDNPPDPDRLPGEEPLPDPEPDEGAARLTRTSTHCPTWGAMPRDSPAAGGSSMSGTWKDVLRDRLPYVVLRVSA